MNFSHVFAVRYEYEFCQLFDFGPFAPLCHEWESGNVVTHELQLVLLMILS